MKPEKYDNKRLLSAIIAAVVIYVVVVICITYLGKASHKINRQHLDTRLISIIESAATLIDGDEHERIMLEGKTGSKRYQTALAPLLKLHNVNPEISYFYTMKDSGGKMCFGLDTATSKDLITEHELEASAVGDVYEVDAETYQTWSHNIKTKGAQVDKEFIEDEQFGSFLTASAPFYNSGGDYVGFVSIDIAPKQFAQHELAISNAVKASLLIALLLSACLGHVVYRKEYAIASLQDTLYKNSITDSLTQSYNRRHFDQNYAIAKNAFKNNNTVYSIAVLDLDNFKAINDKYGHKIGDKTLVEFASIANQEIRLNDKFFRVGGEEFSILFVDTSIQEASKISERIRQKLEEHAVSVSEKESFTITVSIGLAEANSFEGTFQAADAALYEAKKLGRNRVTLA